MHQQSFIKSSSRIILILAAAIAGSTAAVAAGVAVGVARTEKPAVATFHGTGPGGFKIEGNTAGVDVADDGNTVSIGVDLASLSTGIALRDKHMRDKYLEVKQFPKARFDIDKASLQAPTNGKVKAKGRLTLHGKTQPADVEYAVKCDAAGALCDVDGSIAIDMNDYGIFVPSYLGVTMKPAVTVDVSFQVKR